MEGSGFGTSIATLPRPGTGPKTRTAPAFIARARSSARFTTWFTLIPGPGSNSYPVITGPGLIRAMCPLTPKSSRRLPEVSRRSGGAPPRSPCAAARSLPAPSEGRPAAAGTSRPDGRSRRAPVSLRAAPPGAAAPRPPPAAPRRHAPAPRPARPRPLRRPLAAAAWKGTGGSSGRAMAGAGGSGRGSTTTAVPRAAAPYGRARRRGPGRRPSPRAIPRAARRAASTREARAYDACVMHSPATASSVRAAPDPPTSPRVRRSPAATAHPSLPPR